mgnify:CR=1 FL=1
MPDLWEPFNDMADDELPKGSSCEQIHPIIERFFKRLMDGQPPESRDSVVQAISCLATEVFLSSPDHLVEPLLETVSEDDICLWIEQILLVGRAFEIALQQGDEDLDDI